MAGWAVRKSVRESRRWPDGLSESRLGGSRDAALVSDCPGLGFSVFKLPLSHPHSCQSTLPNMSVNIPNKLMVL